MKRLIAILLAILALAGCGKKTSLKIEDPAQRAALRTRDASIPVDKVLSAEGLKTTFNILGEIKPKALVSDFKAANAASEETKALAKAKDAYATVQKDHAEDYNPGLTIYSTVMFLMFIVIVTIKTIRAIFKNS